MDYTTRHNLIRALRDRTQQLALPTRIAAPLSENSPRFTDIGDLLLGRGFEPGNLVEWRNVGSGGGALTLALAVAARLLEGGGAFIVIDGPREFYPPAADRLGVPLDRTAVVRPDDPRAGLWAWEQALRCPAVAVTLGWADELTDRHGHRLQLAAEAGGGLGFLLRSAGPATKAAVRLRVSGEGFFGRPYLLDRRLRVELLHCRGGTPGTSVELELDHETSHVRLVSELADPAASI
ncbi:MAG: ImuA family protein [Gemmataceae bacterium]